MSPQFPREGTKPEVPPELVLAVAKQTARFGTPALAAIARYYLAAHPNAPPHAAASVPPTEACLPELSEREWEVMKLLARGYSNKQVAAKLDVGLKSVETYKARALKKLKLNDRVDLIRYAVAHSWLTDE